MCQYQGVRDDLKKGPDYRHELSEIKYREREIKYASHLLNLVMSPLMSRVGMDTLDTSQHNREQRSKSITS
jgi:hypothetical protein